MNSLIYLNPKKNSSININTTQKSDLNFHRFIRSKAFLSRNFNLDGKKTPKRIDKKKKKKKKKKNKLKRHTIQRGRIIVTKLNYRSTLPVIPLFLKYRPSSPSSRPTLTRHGCLSLKKREATFPSAFNWPESAPRGAETFTVFNDLTRGQPRLLRAF